MFDLLLDIPTKIRDGLQSRWQLGNIHSTLNFRVALCPCVLKFLIRVEIGRIRVMIDRIRGQD